MTKPVYKIETLTGAQLDHTITSDAVAVYCKEIVTDAIGNFRFIVPTRKNGGYFYDDIALHDLVKIYFGYDTVDATPAFVGRVGNITAPLSTSQGYVRIVSGLSQGEILLRRFKTNKYYDATAASTIVSEWATDLGLTGAGKIDSDANTVDLEVKTKNYFDLLRWISDYWVSAGAQIKKDFYVDTANDLVWKSRPIRTAGVESFTVGKDILNYVVTRNVDAVKNNITVYGAAEDPVPSDRDSWTEPTADPPPNWTAVQGTVERGTGGKVGAYYVIGRAADPNGQTVEFTRSIPRQTIRNINTVSFWSNIKMPEATAGYVRLGTLGGTTDYYQADIALNNVLNYLSLTLGPQNEYDAADNPDGKWTPVGSPNWWDVTDITFYGTFTGTGAALGMGVDGFHFFPERWSNTASDATSQTSYGQRDMEVTDDKLHSSGECQKRAEALLFMRKDPVIQIEIAVPGNTNVLVGDRLPMTIPAENISAVNFDVVSVEHTFQKEPVGFQTRATMVDSVNVRHVIAKTNAVMMGDLKRALRELSIDEKPVQ